ncbi:MAG TPA: superoxide dismutase, partial [Tenuifilaceae bacterium]|nr:superoxide dismutase [Tenuifilaceae bacterium]
MKTLAFIILLTSGFAFTSQSQSHFTFPELPYSYDALEVFIDRTTMDIHYNRHHKG